MNNYIGLLRGINVSGQKMIKMPELKKHIEELGFSKIETYIQSGNIIFNSSNPNNSELEIQVQDKIKEKYGFDVATFIKTPEEFRQVITDNPFTDKDLERVYVTFLDEIPEEKNLDKIKATDYSPEEYILSGKTIYFYSPTGYGKAKMNNNFFENKLKVKATTRNWKTVNKLLELVENI